MSARAVTSLKIVHGSLSCFTLVHTSAVHHTANEHMTFLLQPLNWLTSDDSSEALPEHSHKRGGAFDNIAPFVMTNELP